MYLFLVPLIIINLTCSLLYKKNKRPAVVTLFAIGFWGFIFIFVAFCINSIIVKAPFHNLTLEVCGWIALKAVLGVVCTFTWAKGIRHVPVSIAEPFSNIRIFGLLAISWAIFGDSVGFISITLVFAVFAACMTMGYLQHRTEKKHSNGKNYFQGMLWILLWVLLSTVNVSILKQVTISNVDFLTIMMLEMLIFTPITFLVLILSKYKKKQTFKEIIKDPLQIGLGFTDNMWVLFYMPLLLVFNIGVLDSILIITTVLVILFGVIFMKERIRWYIYPFIVIIISCSVALSLLA